MSAGSSPTRSAGPRHRAASSRRTATGPIPSKVTRTGWFTESLLTELCILFVLRTYRPFYRSRPAPYLLWSAAAVFLLTLALPYLPFAAAFHLVPLPASASG